MELRQFRHFVAVVEHGSFSQASAALGVVNSALSQQVNRLEGELATRLLHRTPTGARPTEAGVAFLGQARLALRHADDGQVCAGVHRSDLRIKSQPVRATGSSPSPRRRAARRRALPMSSCCLLSP